MLTFLGVPLSVIVEASATVDAVVADPEPPSETLAVTVGVPRFPPGWPRVNCGCGVAQVIVGPLRSTLIPEIGPAAVVFPAVSWTV